MELISACRRPADDLIKVLKTMISVAAEKQRQPVPQVVDGSDAAPQAAQPFQPTRLMAPKEATLGELIAERGGGKAEALGTDLPELLHPGYRPAAFSVPRLEEPGGRESKWLTLHRQD